MTMTTEEEFIREREAFIKEIEAFQKRIETFVTDYIERLEASDLSKSTQIGIKAVFVTKLTGLTI